MGEPSEADVRRARGDGWVAVSGALVGVGALAAGALALLAVGGRVRAVLERWAADGLGGGGVASPGALVTVLLALVAPVLGAAWVGAMVVGLAQTRALLAWGGERAPHERERLPLVGRALLAAGVVLIGVQGVRALLSTLLGGAAPAEALAAAAASVVPRLLAWCLAMGLVELGWRRARLAAALVGGARGDAANPGLAAERRRRMR